jgi:hypothetical protein
MRKRDRYLPYIRRANGNEGSGSILVSLDITLYRLTGRPFFVMVQRGYPNIAIAVGKTRRDLQRRLVSVRSGRITFKQWARGMRKWAHGYGGKNGQ